MRRSLGTKLSVTFAAGIGAALAGCVLGSPEEPGCAEDAECGDGFVCRAGACLEELVGTPAPVDAGGTGGTGGNTTGGTGAGGGGNGGAGGAAGSTGGTGGQASTGGAGAGGGG